ncbi:MAG TPA: cyclic nucleotide-binding domain-containing protein, partial [Rhodocyclaceae bacterium]|nr:cyclic nucleotide-binding domain-containing protein [Rhodocyclaceae bacterium]
MIGSAADFAYDPNHVGADIVDTVLKPIPETLRGLAQLQTFGLGETIFRQGERPKAVLCVLTGEIRLVRLSRAGGEIILQRSRGGFIAEASLESSAYHCDAIA